MYENVIKVLLVEDDENDYLLTRGLLAEIESSRLDLTWASTYEEALETTKIFGPDVCLIDYRLGEYNGIELLREMAERGYRMPVILLTGQDDLDIDLKAMRAGASDYLVKGQIDRPLLERSIRYTIERAKTLEALRTSENRYRRIVETAREGIWMIDEEARTNYVNQRMAEMLGYTVDDMLGRHVSDFMDEAATRETLQNFERRKQGVSEQYERLLKHRDGTELWVLIATNPIYGPNGEFVGSLGMITNITERKQAEEDLRRQLDFTEAITASLGEGVYALDLKGRVTFMNPAAEAALGWKQEELLGQQIHGVIHCQYSDGTTRPASECQLLRVLKTDRMTLVESDVFTRRDGSILPVSYTSSPIITGGQVVGAVLAFHDIAERKLEEEVRERLASIVESSQDAILSKTLDGIITSWNAGAEKMYGYMEAEAVGRHISLIVPPGHQRELTEIMSKLRRGEQIKQLKTVRVRKDGSLVDVSITISPIKSAGGQLVGASTSARDITESKRADELLRKSEERYREMVENARDIIYSHDLQGNYTSVNLAGEQIFGYTRDEILGMNLSQTIAPEYLEETRRMIDRKLAGEGKTVYEVEALAKDGRRITFEVNSRLVYQDGIAVGVQGIARDITERKRAEEMMRLADRRAVEEYERLLDRLARLALTFGTARDLQTNYRALRDFALALTPSFALVICHYDEERAVREGAYFYINGVEIENPILEQMPVRSGPASRVIKSATALIFNDYLEEINGGKNAVCVGLDVDNEKPRSALIAPMAIMGRVIGTVEVQSHELNAYTREHATAMQMAANLAANAIENVRLLNMEREKEEQLRQSQKMEAVGRLAGGVAHDFNNLLTAINGYSELTMRRLQSEDPLRHNLEEIKKAGNRAATLTRQLLAFSRKQVLQPKVLNLNAVISDLEKMLSRLIGEDIDWRAVLGPDLGCVKADPGQMEQVIVNLVVNARDAMPNGGKLTIETENVNLDEAYAQYHVTVEPGYYVMLTISDNGCGMSGETRARIFEPFFTTKEEGKGTGLGLSTVYGIVKQSKGNIWVYSEIGEGTTFKIYLPRVEEEVDNLQQSQHPQMNAQGTETLMLAEDDEMVRQIARRILEMSGYQVLEASNGPEALVLLEQYKQPIHLMLTDVIMPGMSGHDIAEQAARLRPEMIILYMSGYTKDAIVHHGVLNEGVNFIEKPFTPYGLASKVREVLDASPRSDDYRLQELSTTIR
ncbi:MAG TPA: PAS domain S-box protein [Pyrinomonadaceae bacterium]|jgi:PAS domain S-box-containing protein